MTPPTNPTNPTNPPTDDELEARLRASFDRATARAADDPATSGLARSAVEGSRPRGGRRGAWGVVATAGLVLVLGVVIVVGGGSRRESTLPSMSPAAPPSSPVAANGSPAPAGTPQPGEVSTIPVLNPSDTFPPTVEGQPVVAVGPAADARIAAATDDSPIYLSGWMLGTDQPGCLLDFDYGSPAPNGVLFKACAAIPIHETQDGGSVVPVHWSQAQRQSPGSLPRLPSGPMVWPILLQVHVHDPGCGSADCATTAVLDRVIAYGAPRVAKPLLAMTLPTGGLSAEQAIAAARAYDVDSGLGFREPKVVQSVEAGPRILVGSSSREMDLTWYWVVRMVSDDGFQDYTIYVNYLDGSVTEAEGGSVGLQ